MLTALLIPASVGLLVGAIRFRLLPVKILCGSLSIVVAMTGGIAAVNYYYGYYTTWGQLWADFHGGTGDLGVISATAARPRSRRAASAGSPCPASSAATAAAGWCTCRRSTARPVRAGPVPRRRAVPRHPRLPAHLGHGAADRPGRERAIARHLIGPMVLVMPAINGSGHHYQDCVNGPGVSDDTCLAKDVRADVLAHYRVSHDPYEWGMAGYSSGGYCAANLALRHRSSFGAAAVINGYFRAADGPAGTALNHSQPLEAANSPLYLAERLTPAAAPCPPSGSRPGTTTGPTTSRRPFHRRARPHRAGPLLQAQRRRHRQRLVRPPCLPPWPGSGSSSHRPTCGSCSPSAPRPRPRHRCRSSP